MTYDEMLQQDKPRWVVVDLNLNEIYAEEWSYTYAQFDALDAEQEKERYMHDIRIYDRMSELDYQIVENYFHKKE